MQNGGREGVLFVVKVSKKQNISCTAFTECISSSNVGGMWWNYLSDEEMRQWLFAFLGGAVGIKKNAVTIDPVTVKTANWLLIRQPEQ